MNTRTGKGRIWSPHYGSSELNETLKILNPRKVQYFRLSEQEEEMKRNFPETIHRVFRENDLRRYSMFYHRCMGYRLAREWEEEHGMRFDWVALIRLDAAWLEPVLPIQYYANDRVWLTETGFVPFNDQFMLIPRQYSDYLYDLNTKVRKEVYCLGGPDVEKWKCNATVLAMRKFPKRIINETLSYCCEDVATDDRLGYSETIHYRHLQFGKIPVSLARFTVYIVRYTRRVTWYADCARLTFCFRTFLEDYLGGYEYWQNASTVDATLDSRLISLSFIDGARCSFVNHRFLSPWQPINATELHRLVSLNLSLALNYSENLYQQFDKLHPSLLNNPWQFSNWRIRPNVHLDSCLSFDFVNKSLYWSQCQDHLLTKLGRRHLPTQTFFLLVTSPPQSHIGSFNGVYDLIRDENTVFHFEKLPLPNKMRIFLHDRTPPPDHHLMFDFFCLTVMPTVGNNGTMESSTTILPVAAQKCAEYDDNPHQWFKTIHTPQIGSKAHFLQTPVESFAFPGYCLIVTVDFAKLRSADINMHHFHPKTKFPSTAYPDELTKYGSGLGLVNCSDPDFNRQRLFEIELLKP
jgi:hypothetical protein